MDKINININKDDNIINDYLSSWSNFGSRPNKITIYTTYSSVGFHSILDGEFIDKNINSEIIPDDDSLIINDKVLSKINDSIYVSYYIIDRNSENSIVNELTFFYKDAKSDLVKIEEVVDKLNKCIIDFCDDSSIDKLNTISIGPNGIEIDPIMVDTNDDIELYYNDSTFSKIKKLIKSIKKKNKGLSIIHGERGTGKTSIINYISLNIDRMTIYIPNNMIEHTINNPDFKRFLRKYNKILLVLDDCEILFNESFYNKANMLTNNLLQLVDGLISNSIDVHIITIFNSDNIDVVDHSLMECNNLIDSIEFNYLSKDESTELSKHIGDGVKYKEEHKLIDILKKRKKTTKVGIGI